MSQKRYANTAVRRKVIAGVGVANERGRRTPIVPTSVESGGATATLNLDQAVQMKGLPNYLGDGEDSITVTAASFLAPNVIQLVFSAAVGTSIVIPFEDPAIRNNVGGYVQPGTYLFPE